MYEEFFGMKHTPFTNQIPANALFLSTSITEAAGRLCYAAEHQLFTVLTGEVGVGKSTTIRRVKATLPEERFLVLYLSDSQLTPRWFYNGLLQQLGAEPRFQRGDAKLSLHHQLEYIREARHMKVVTIVDEAHLLKKETLEEIRFMLNCQMDSMNPMALILVGQNELWDKLVKPAYAAIRQRIDQFAARLSSAPRALKAAERRALLRELKASGSLEVRRAMEVVAQHLGVSRATVYGDVK